MQKSFYSLVPGLFPGTPLWMLPSPKEASVFTSTQALLSRELGLCRSLLQHRRQESGIQEAVGIFLLDGSITFPRNALLVSTSILTQSHFF